MSTMKAWRIHSYGGPECMQLDEVAMPEPGDSQILVKISKSGINPFDWKVREGWVRDHVEHHDPMFLPAILGVDFVGTVVSLGKGSSGLSPGQRVMGMSATLGAHAEYIVVPEKHLARSPDSIDDTAAATLPIPALSAWTALNTAEPVKPGMKVLIHGASGIVGAFAVQMAKNNGAEVIGTASAKNRDYCLELGVDKFIDYQTENFEELVKDVDLVLDFVLVGGDRNTTDRSWDVLKTGGTIVSLTDPTIMGKIPDGYRGFFPQVQPNVPVLEDIAQQVADGKLKYKVAQLFPFSELVKAMELSKAGGTTGRLIVDVKGDN